MKSIIKEEGTNAQANVKEATTTGKQTNCLMKNKLKQLQHNKQRPLQRAHCKSKTKGEPSNLGDTHHHHHHNEIKKTIKKDLSLNDLNYSYMNQRKRTISGEISPLKDTGMKWAQNNTRRYKSNSPINDNGHYKTIHHFSSKANPLFTIREHSKPNSFLDKICRAINNKLDDINYNSKNGIKIPNVIRPLNKITTTHHDSMTKRKKKMTNDCCQTSEVYYPKNNNLLMTNITQHYFDKNLKYYQTLVHNPFSPYSSGYNFEKLTRKYNLEYNNQTNRLLPYFHIPQDRILVSH